LINTQIDNSSIINPRRGLAILHSHHRVFVQGPQIRAVRPEHAVMLVQLFPFGTVFMESSLLLAAKGLVSN
jgi:hypothetical protein